MLHALKSKLLGAIRQIKNQCTIFTTFQVKSMLALQNFSRTRKRGNISHIPKVFFIRHSSEYETLLSDVSYSDECQKKQLSVCERCCHVFVLNITGIRKLAKLRVNFNPLSIGFDTVLTA